MKRQLTIISLLFLFCLALHAQENDSIATPDSVKEAVPTIAKPNYIDEVVWVVGDEAILRSDIEIARMQAEQEGITWDGDPDCRIPESIAVQKLFSDPLSLDQEDLKNIVEWLEKAKVSSEDIQKFFESYGIDVEKINQFFNPTN